MTLRDRIRQKSPQPDVTEAESTSRYDEGIDDWPPPVRETAAQRALRLEEEREAKRVNDEIDMALEAERLERKKRKVDVKILLLGAPLSLSTPEYLALCNMSGGASQSRRWEPDV